MILDSGICSVFRRGERAFARLTQSWYGELSFETQPSKENLNDGVQTGARIRIHEARNISHGDVIVLRDVSTLATFDPCYEVVRAYHGQDDDNGLPITDLTLTASLMTEALKLVPGTEATDGMGAKNIRPGTLNRRTVAAEVLSVTRAEQYAAMAYTGKPQLQALIYADEYGGEPYAQVDGVMYAIVRTEKNGIKTVLGCEEVDAWDTA
jgi:hypothetical protein